MMNLSDRTFSSELPMRKPTKKLIVDHTTTCFNKSATKHFAIGWQQKKKKERETKVNLDRCGINHFIEKENPYFEKKMMEGVI